MDRKPGLKPVSDQYKTSAMSPRDVALLRLHTAFDEITEILDCDCHHTEETKKALEQVSFLRSFVIKTFSQQTAVK